LGIHGYGVLPSLSGYFAKLSFLMEKEDADRQMDEAKKATATRP
jgi:hypothetical protein